MDLTPYVESLRRRLSVAAAARGEDARPELGSVEVCLHGGEPEFVVTPSRRAPVGRGRAASAAESGSMTRTTLRLPGDVKSRVETAAAHDGASINTWLIHAVTAALERGRSTGTSRR